MNCWETFNILSIYPPQILQHILQESPPEFQEIQRDEPNNLYASNMLTKWELYKDDQDIAYIAQLLECSEKYNGFPSDVIFYIQNTLGVDLNAFYIDTKMIQENNSKRIKYVEQFIRLLFQNYTMKHNIKLSETVNKWLTKFEYTFTNNALEPIRNILIDLEWQWE